MHIYGVLHLRSGVTSAGRYVSEEGVSRWGTGWLFLGWKFASRPKLMILKTRVCRRAIAKVFQNFVGVCQTWTTKSPQSRLVLIYAWIKSFSWWVGVDRMRHLFHIESHFFTWNSYSSLPFPYGETGRLLNKDLKSSAVFKEVLPWKGPSAWSLFHMQRKFDFTSKAS